MKSLFCKLTVFLGLTSLAQGVDVTMGGSWHAVIDASNLVSGAGSDLQSEIESPPGAINVSISNALLAWSLYVRLADAGHENVKIYVRRTSAGSGISVISGGSNYMEITNSDSLFFSGLIGGTIVIGGSSNIGLQFKITGLSRDIPPATYLSSIVFTVQ